MQVNPLVSGAGEGEGIKVGDGVVRDDPAPGRELPPETEVPDLGMSEEKSDQEDQRQVQGGKETRGRLGLSGHRLIILS